MSELSRLYLSDGALSADAAERHAPRSLSTADGLTRALVIPFARMADAAADAHWTRLCAVANALQTELGFPAPAVSISGHDGYALWLSFEVALPVAQVQHLLAVLRTAYFPELDLGPELVLAPVSLPPCPNPVSGNWSAFIHPGLGASFADEPWLEMAPPFAGQCALLEHVESIGPGKLSKALQTLGHGAAPTVVSASPGLLLADATLEDIVRHLHAKHIEPTFRHLIGRQS